MNPSINEQGNVDSSNVLRIDIFFIGTVLRIDMMKQDRGLTRHPKNQEDIPDSAVITLCIVEEHCAHF